MNFTVQIIAKSYVKRFIDLCCGNPADLSKLPDINLFFLESLKKPEHFRDSMYKKEIRGYTEIIEVKISENYFYKYGWELSKTDIIIFGKKIENRIKLIMRIYVAIFYAIDYKLKDAIEEFQKEFYIPEDFWSYEAIKKDFYRNGLKIKFDFKSLIIKTLRKIILHNLSLDETFNIMEDINYASA